MRPVFADPRTDFVFKRLFGKEEHAPLLIALLNDLLELDGERCIAEVELLDGELRPPVREMKHSIVDVKCRDRRGIHYVVEMQVLNVEGFAKRVMYNVAKAYTSQLGAGEAYPRLDDVIGVSICDFELWHKGEVPMLSRWRMQEQHSGAQGLSQLQFVFLELPKYTAGDRPQTTVERWAYFFRDAANLDVVPEVLSESPMKDALEVARCAGFTEEEWEAYIRDGMALQDERGALSKARAEGLEQGREQGLLAGIMTACQLLDIPVDDVRSRALDELDADRLQALLTHLQTRRAWPPDAQS